jgi:hypothetical protein
MAALESHIPKTQLTDALAWERSTMQTAAKIHDEVGQHDAAGLSKTVAQIDVADLQAVQGNYQALYGKKLTDVVASDEKLPQVTRTQVAEQLNRELQPPKSEADCVAFTSAVFGQMQRIDALKILGSGELAIEQSRLLAQLGSNHKDLGGELKRASSFGSDNQKRGEQGVQEGAVETQDAERSLRKTVASFSADELKAIEEYSLIHASTPGQGVLERLAGDHDISMDTRSFIADLSKKG